MKLSALIQKLLQPFQRKKQTPEEQAKTGFSTVSEYKDFKSKFLPYVAVIAIITGLGTTLYQVQTRQDVRQQAQTSPISVIITPGTITQYDVVEMTFTLPTTYSNPYDPEVIDVNAIITLPDGKVEKVSAFWYESVQYTPGTSDNLQPVANSGIWKVRYAPRMVGTYQYKIEAKEPTKTITSPTANFTVGVSASKGFIKRDSLNQNRLAFENGDPYFVVGANLAWSELGLHSHDDHTAYKTWMQDMKSGKYNFARVWINYPCHPFLMEWTGTVTDCSGKNKYVYQGLGKYNQEAAFQIDYLLEQAKANDIYLSLVLTGYYTIADQKASNPYTPLYGGTDVKAFWTNTAARKKFSHYTRYIGARYGAYRNVAMFEYWNELNNTNTDPLTLPNGREVMRSWHQQMEDALHASTPRNPMTTTSYSSLARHWTDPDGLDSFNSLPMMEVTKSHWYLHTDTNALKTWIDLGTYGRNVMKKPYFIGEYGSVGEEAYPSTKTVILNRLNHHSSWVPIMLGGMAGNANLWRVNWNFNPPLEFRTNTKRFMDWFEPEQAYIRRMSFFWGGETLSGFWAGGYKKSNRAFMYFLNKDAKWNIEDTAFGQVSNATYNLTNMAHGSYTVQFTNPLTGSAISSTTVQVTNGTLTLTLPTFKRDLAVKVFDPSETPQPQPTDDPNVVPTMTPTPTAAPSITTGFLSDQNWLTMTNGYGPAEKNTNNGENAANDGGPIILGGQTFAKGLGVHATSDIAYNIASQCTQFTAKVGVDDSVGANGSIVFQVYLDSVKVFDSGVMTGNTATKDVAVPLTGKKELRLFVTNGGDTFNYDKGNWADAKVTCGTISSPTATPTVTPTPNLPSKTPTPTLTSIPPLTPTPTQIVCVTPTVPMCNGRLQYGTPTPVPNGCAIQPIACLTATPVPSTTQKQGDANRDGSVNVQDYNSLVTQFNQTGTNLSADFNSSGKVDVQDYNILVSNFGK